MKKEVIISARKINIYTFVVSPLLFGVYAILYMFFFEKTIIDSIKQYDWSNEYFILVIFFSVLFGGIVLHELLHGLTWAFFCKKGIRSIRFGIFLKHLMPYCHCIESLKVKHYLAGLISPVVLLGITPTLIAIFLNHVFLLFFGYFFTISATGDLIILFYLLDFNLSDIVMDHPNKVGFLIQE